jgi:hypothetical protein
LARPHHTAVARRGSPTAELAGQIRAAVLVMLLPPVFVPTGVFAQGSASLWVRSRILGSHLQARGNSRNSSARRFAPASDPCASSEAREFRCFVADGRYVDACRPAGARAPWRERLPTALMCLISRLPVLFPRERIITIHRTERSSRSRRLTRVCSQARTARRNRAESCRDWSPASPSPADNTSPQISLSSSNEGKR